ncbi:MAG: hypothetical protein AVDCRST_MAG66-4300 [uncultured Pseudonocardia sp.]|uniref:Uncharacterized protein n=1 Tax=uncultured Pseudonocardia sp. TaxID=211455 RepID=A0A6J4QII7_9PSEU|nr:MAG: hypothetical protein AVDCRST_MAG66-4300 [uncultured Pseudonocardia sp.]
MLIFPCPVRIPERAARTSSSPVTQQRPPVGRRGAAHCVDPVVAGRGSSRWRGVLETVAIRRIDVSVRWPLWPERAEARSSRPRGTC